MEESRIKYVNFQQMKKMIILHRSNKISFMFYRYVKYNPTNDMLITGIRRENQISSFGINDEPDENHETRLISCSSFFDHLLRSLSSIIDNIDPNSFVNLGHYWSHIQIHTGNYYNVLRKRDKVQLQPVKFVSRVIKMNGVVCCVFLIWKFLRFYFFLKITIKELINL